MREVLNQLRLVAIASYDNYVVEAVSEVIMKNEPRLAVPSCHGRRSLNTIRG